MMTRRAHLIDSGLTFDIDSLSMSLTTNSFLKKNSVPLDTLTGIRTTRATMAIGKNIFNLPLSIDKENPSEFSLDGL